MSAPVIGLRFLGRLGNSMFSYAFARAHAERTGARLCTDAWIGQQIFELNEEPVPMGLPRRDENTLGETEVNCEIRSYCQQQKCLIYTREQVRRWFRFRPDIAERLAALPVISDRIAHVRRGDYQGYGYPMPSLRAYADASLKAGISGLYFMGEDDAALRAPFGLSDELAMLPDFYRMVRAKVLFRANSSFSWWAATLGQSRVFAPVIAGCRGGQEHDCPFVEGNWPRLHNLDFTTDLHLPES